MPIRPLLLALAVLLAASAAGGQETPRRLLPPAAPQPPETASQPSPPPAATEPPIRSEAIGAPSLSTVGLGRPAFGFAGPLWPDADPERLLALFERLPERLALPALRELARRLLTVPGPPIDNGLALLLARARTLEHIGDPRLAAELLAAPGEAEGRAMREENALVALAAAGRSAEACALAEGAADEAVRLAAVRIVCALRAGDAGLAGLRLELARERGLVFTPDFLAMLEAARAGRPLSVTLPTAVERPAVLLLIAGLPVGEARVEGELAADPAMLAALARNPRTPARIRLRAAEAAAAAGWLDADGLRGVYLEAATEGDPSRAGERAGLVARLAAETVPAARAALLVEAVEARAAGIERLYWLRVLAPYARTLIPDPALDWAAEAVLLGLLAAGETATVADWAMLLERRVEATGEGRPARARIARLLALAGLRPLPPELGMPDDRRRLLFATLAEGLGLALPPADGVWLLANEVTGAAEAPPLFLWLELEAARDEGRAGEGLLAALALLGDAPEGAAPLALWQALRGLVALGEEATARAAAVELALVWRL